MAGGVIVDDFDGPVWLDRLIHGRDAAPEVVDTEPDGPLVATRPRGPWGVGLKDTVAAGWFDAARGELAPGLPIGPEDVVVDVGCGEGNLLGFCAARGARVIGLDNHEGTLDAARARLAEHQDRSQFRLTGASDPLPLPDGVATVVVCTEVLEHVANPQALAAELVRIGGAGCRYLVSVPSAESEALMRSQAPPSYFQPPNHVNVFSSAAFRQLLADADLVVDRELRLGFFWTVWWTLYWHTGASANNGRHEVLELWAATWNRLLNSPGGVAAKQALDEVLPKTQVVLAHKP